MSDEEYEKTLKDIISLYKTCRGMYLNKPKDYLSEEMDTHIQYIENKLTQIKNRRNNKMSNNLEQMVEIWEDKFLPLIEDFEDMEYFIEFGMPEETEGAMQKSLSVPLTNIRRFFEVSDKFYGRGYRQAVIYHIKTESIYSFEESGMSTGFRIKILFFK